jgi:hypothetical protein
VKHSVPCRGFRVFTKGTLVGDAAVLIPELRFTIFDVALHQKNAAHWVQLLSKHMAREGRRVINEATWKPLCPLFIEFEDRETRDAFSEAVWQRP